MHLLDVVTRRELGVCRPQRHTLLILPCLLETASNQKVQQEPEQHQHVMLVGGPADDIRIHKSLGPTLGLLAFGEVAQRKIRSNFEKTE